MLRKPSRDANDMRREQQTDAFNLLNRVGGLRDPDVLRDGGLEFGVNLFDCSRGEINALRMKR